MVPKVFEPLKFYCNYHLTVHLGTFVIYCIRLLLHIEIKGECRWNIRGWGGGTLKLLMMVIGGTAPSLFPTPMVFPVICYIGNSTSLRDIASYWPTSSLTLLKHLHWLKIVYNRTSMARTPLGPWKLVRDRGSSSQWGLIIAPGQEA